MNDPRVTDRELRKKLEDEDYKPSGSGVKVVRAPKILMREAFRVARTAADKARALLGRSK